MNDNMNYKSNKIDIKSSHYCFATLPPKQFSVLAGILGVVISDELSINEKNALGNFLVTVGQAILTEAAQEQALESNSNNMDLIEEINELKRQIELLKQSSKGM
ncbi:hypothetical protein I5677_04845 [Mobilitalea sibirica]|uniref:Uncharacterized protein n=1 Tax=Mobilitalea sibirica TaxID=1462919 RepID=A0A8J7L2B1_9FIRM|nr:hypothetical protein [Mobilitalea sibirica]MBH1940223.1 hypothetical protein [Mobilitalea sibirica]